MKIAEVKLEKYGPETVWSFNVTVASDYDMSGKEVELELSHNDSVVFRYRSGVDNRLLITGQVDSVNMQPAADSLDSLGKTFAQATALHTAKIPVKINLDFYVQGSDDVDYRLQGDMDVAPEHGRF